MPKNRTFSENEIQKVVHLKSEGVAVAQIAKELGRSKSAVFNIINKHQADIDIANNEKESKAVDAQIGPQHRLPGKNKKPEENNEAQEKPLTKADLPPRQSPALDITQTPEPADIYGLEENSAIKLFMDSTKEAVGKMKTGMADQMFKNFMQDLEMIPHIRDLRIQYKPLYEMKKMDFFTFLATGAKLLAYQINRVEKILPSPESFMPQEKKGVDINEIMKAMMTMKMLDNL